MALVGFVITQVTSSPLQRLCALGVHRALQLSNLFLQLHRLRPLVLESRVHLGGGGRSSCLGDLGCGEAGCQIGEAGCQIGRPVLGLPSEGPLSGGLGGCCLGGPAEEHQRHALHRTASAAAASRRP